MALALGNSGQGATVASGTTFTVSVTAAAGTMIVIQSVSNDATVGDAGNIVSVTGAGLTWTRRALVSEGGTMTGLILAEYWAFTPTAISAQTVTVTATNTLAFGVASYFTIQGAYNSSPYDGVAVTAGSSLNNADPLSITTSNPSDFIYGGFATLVSSELHGTGWLPIVSANFQLLEYQIVNAKQTALSVSCSTASASNRAMANAVREWMPRPNKNTVRITKRVF